MHIIISNAGIIINKEEKVNNASFILIGEVLKLAKMLFFVS